MTAELVSPLAAWTSRLPSTVSERPFLSQLTVRSSDTAAMGSVLGVAFPSRPCTFTEGSGRFGDVSVLWLGPDEYLVVAEPGLQVPIEEGLRACKGSVVDTSAQRTTLVLEGPHVRDVLAHGCSVDLHPAAAPVGTCVQTLLARTGIILQVTGADTFTLLVRSSFAEYLAAWLCDASVEYGLLGETPVTGRPQGHR
ncbi:sarcosine oxidase subunit gamma [Lentzea sp. NBRC 105346]|uniref:sarcosine oxidase subunit gamma n=1 Tax=Lentzea sp. NBRC 105346 TaxID=3032205 RepID=UPI0024A20C53|nr:sarcosine oxidase subunit gamma family protein [Lentzea sp. NBRC 105346]GLZ35306.1 sarcosine oxidase subunit gamma [Lentzea sp. NBRC 105346]